MSPGPEQVWTEFRSGKGIDLGKLDLRQQRDGNGIQVLSFSPTTIRPLESSRYRARFFTPGTLTLPESEAATSVISLVGTRNSTFSAEPALQASRFKYRRASRQPIISSTSTLPLLRIVPSINRRFQTGGVGAFLRVSDLVVSGRNLAHSVPSST